MAKPAVTFVTNATLQVYALLFLVLGIGMGAALGASVGATKVGDDANLTVVHTVRDGTPRAFNWLFFEIGMAAGFIACAVLLAASIQAVQSRDSVPEIIEVIPGTRSSLHP
jgi:bacteriorhodopsin